jgi:hypothetical protein
MAYHKGKFIYYQYVKQFNFVAIIKELFSFLDPYAEIEAHKLGTITSLDEIDNDNSTAKIQDALIRAESEEDEEPVEVENDW